MTLKKTRTCEGCKAAHYDHLTAHCALAFKTTTERSPVFGMPVLKPAEPCWKPRTDQEFVDCLREYTNQNQQSHEA